MKPATRSATTSRAWRWRTAITLWLVSDETRSVERLSLERGRFGAHRRFDLGPLLGLPAGPGELDLEGLDLDGAYLWVVGGFGSKRKAVDPGESDAKNIRRLAKVEGEPDRCLLARIPIVGGELVAASPGPAGRLAAARLASSGGGNPLLDAITNDEHIGPFLKAGIPSKDNGLDIEALAATGDRVLLGLRGPVLRGWAILLEIEVEERTPGLLALRPIGAGGRPYRKHFVDLGGLGFRDLCPEGPDLLILAGPAVLLDGPARIYRLSAANALRDDVLHRPELVLELPHGRGDDHPEGMTLTTDPSGRRSVLVVYDGPSPSRLAGSDDVTADIFALS